VTDISIVAAFTGGIISFFSPCVLPLLPVYISFMSSISLEELHSNAAIAVRTKVLVNSIFFILGFSFVFVLLGASATYLGQLLLTKLILIQKIAGIVIIIFGLHLIGLFRIKFLLYEKRLHKEYKKMGMVTVFLLGVSFAFGWTPCVGPILAGILGIAATKENVSQGIFLLSVYSLGLGLPFFLTALATDRFLGYFNRLKKHLRIVEILSGLFLITIGIMIFFDFFTLISSFINRTFPFLQNIG